MLQTLCCLLIHYAFYKKCLPQISIKTTIVGTVFKSV